MACAEPGDVLGRKGGIAEGGGHGVGDRTHGGQDTFTVYRRGRAGVRPGVAGAAVDPPVRPLFTLETVSCPKPRASPPPPRTRRAFWRRPAAARNGPGGGWWSCTAGGSSRWPRADASGRTWRRR